MEEVSKFRICKKCGETKETTKDFSFQVSIGYYRGVCKDCFNNYRREKRNCNKESKNSNNYLIKQIECIKCHTIKNNTEFAKLGKVTTKVCNSCVDAFNKLNKEQRLNKSPFDDSILKTCFRCKISKSISEFSYLSSDKRFSPYCRKCDHLKGRLYRANLSEEQLEERRKKEKNRKIKDNSKHLFNSYNKFDFIKGFETNLTLEFIQEQLKFACIYCTYPSTGLDRLDNTKGHTHENCVPCCRQCNTTRMDNYSHEEMLLLGKVIKQIKDKRYGT